MFSELSILNYVKFFLVLLNVTSDHYIEWCGNFKIFLYLFKRLSCLMSLWIIICFFYQCEHENTKLVWKKLPQIFRKLLL